MPELAKAWEEAGGLGRAWLLFRLCFMLMPSSGVPGVEVIYASEVMLRRHSSGHQQSETSEESMVRAECMYWATGGGECRHASGPGLVEQEVDLAENVRVLSNFVLLKTCCCCEALRIRFGSCKDMTYRNADASRFCRQGGFFQTLLQSLCCARRAQEFRGTVLKIGVNWGK